MLWMAVSECNKVSSNLIYLSYLNITQGRVGYLCDKYCFLQIFREFLEVECTWEVQYLQICIISDQFLAAKLALAGFPLTNALGESMPSRH